MARLVWQLYFVAYVSGTAEFIWAHDEAHARARVADPEDPRYTGKDVESVSPVPDPL